MEVAFDKSVIASIIHGIATPLTHVNVIYKISHHDFHQAVALCSMFKDVLWKIQETFYIGNNFLPDIKKYIYHNFNFNINLFRTHSELTSSVFYNLYHKIMSFSPNDWYRHHNFEISMCSILWIINKDRYVQSGLISNVY